MDLRAYHLQARSAFQFGLRGVGIEASAPYAPSDTVFSALCHALRQQFGVDTLEEFLQGYKKVGGIQLPHKTVIHQEGQLFLESETSKLSTTDVIPAAKFAKAES